MTRLAMVAALLLASAAHAQQGTPPAPKAERRPVAAYGDDHPDCKEWTDGCIVCLRESDGPACSMPGIACLPAEEPECRKQTPR